MTSASSFDDEDRPPLAPAEQPPVLAPPGGHSVTAQKNRRHSNWVAILVALLGLGVLVVLVIGCSGGHPAVLLLVGVVVGMLLLHYLTWGRLLNRNSARAEESSSEE